MKIKENLKISNQIAENYINFSNCGTAKKIGIFGGSFNPIHNGHLYIASEFLTHCKLDSCIFVPAKVSPFKINNFSKISEISPDERFESVKEAIKINEKFCVSDFEIKSEEISYTIETVRHFRQIYPAAELFLLIGADQAIKFDKWRNYEEILEILTLVIAKRQPLPTPGELIFMKQIFCGKGIWLNNEIIPVSSSEIRNKLKKNNRINATN